MSKPQKPKKIELTLRIDEGDPVLDRLEWIEYNRKDLKTRNAALREALETWLASMEVRHGISPKAAPKGKRASL